MITECANPKCRRPFVFFRGGKLFVVDGRSQTGSPSTPGQAPRKLEHFWLCEHCAATMTLVVRQGKTPELSLTVSEDIQLAEKRLRGQSDGTV